VYACGCGCVLWVRCGAVCNGSCEVGCAVAFVLCSFRVFAVEKEREREEREKCTVLSLLCVLAVRCHTLTFGVLRCTLQDCSPPRSPLAQAQQRCVHHSRNRVTGIPRCGNSNVADSPSPAPLNHPKRPAERRQTTTWRQQNTPELTIFSPAHPVLIFLADICCLRVFSKKTRLARLLVELYSRSLLFHPSGFFGDAISHTAAVVVRTRTPPATTQSSRPTCQNVFLHQESFSVQQ
jgi:hypothetical protein